jgi:hypothetical protein
MVASEILDRLYSVPLDEFTKTRNDLSSELKASGDKEAAAEVKALKKPPLSAWAVNQLAVQHRADLEELFHARDRIAEATNARDMRTASEERKTALTGLLARAREVLESSGHPASSSTIERITQTLQSGDEPDEREAILAGHLGQDLTPSGFGGLAGFAGFDEDASADEEEDAGRREREAKAAALGEEATLLEEEAAEAEAAAGAKEDDARQARKVADRARSRADKARQKAEKAAAGCR